MSYSIKAVSKGYANKEGKTKIFIQVIYQRVKVYAPTLIQVPLDNFESGSVVKHEKRKYYNAVLTEQRNEIETRLLEALRRDKDISKTKLEEVVKGKLVSVNTIQDYVFQLCDELQNKVTKGRLTHFKSTADKVERFAKGAKLSDINLTWLNKFEAWLRKQPGRDGLMENNTVQTKMKIIHAICGYAEKAGLMDKKQYSEYQMPGYEEKVPEYLTEAEMTKFFNLLQVIEQPGMKLAGYYFLLSCYAGYRISDLKKFDYGKMVKGDRIVLRATKNKKIVSIAIHTRLQQVLDYIHDKPLYMSEPHMRAYVHELAKSIGLSRKIKVHTARHSFGMLLMESGFKRDDAATLLGDSKDVAKVYFRISDKYLDNEVKSRLG